MQKRIELVDALRGFSLLGILIANMLYFQYDQLIYDDFHPTNWWDTIAYYFTKIFVEGSFFPIFGFIFGYSIILFVRSLENRELSTKGPLFRRAIGLIILGIIHIVFIWDGDILIIYGSGLLILMYFIKREVKTMFIWAIVLFVCTMPFLLMKSDNLSLILPNSEAMIEVLKNGTYFEVINNRVGLEMDISFITLMIVLCFVVVFLTIISFLVIGPFVLIGMAAAKIDFFKNIEEKIGLLKRLSFLIPVGLVCKAFFETDYFAGKLLYNLGANILAIGYIALFTVIFISMKQSKLSLAFVHLGRLSLTSYLMQSIICTTIFYGYGFGLFGKLGVFLGLVLAVIIYVLQLFVANWYGQRYSKGPAEWLLRKFVYLSERR